jgi:hypothetical protein
VLRVKRLLLAAALALASGACQSEAGSPEDAVRSLLEAINQMDPEKVHALLASDTREQLAKRAAMATEHTGGRRQLTGAEMLLLGLDQLQLELDSVEVLEQTDSRARVKLASKKHKTEEVLQLVKEDGRWLVRLVLSKE